MAELIALLLTIIIEAGNLSMFVCGILGCVGILNISLGGSIVMIVLGTIFGVLPMLKPTIKVDKE